MKQASRICMATCLLVLMHPGPCAYGAQTTAAASHRKLRAVDADGSIILFNAEPLPQAIAVGEPNPGQSASPGPVIVDPVPSPSPRIITDPLPSPSPHIITDPLPSPSPRIIMDPLPSPSPRIITDPLPSPSPSDVPVLPEPRIPVDVVCYQVDVHDSSVVTAAKFAIKTIDELSWLLQDAFHTSNPIKFGYVTSAQRCDMPSWGPSQPGLMRYTMTVMVWVPYHKGHKTFYYKAPISVEVHWYTDSDLPRELTSMTFKDQTWSGPLYT